MTNLSTALAKEIQFYCDAALAALKAGIPV